MYSSESVTVVMLWYGWRHFGTLDELGVVEGYSYLMGMSGRPLC